ncbi:MAG TPA: hypothetical protein ENO31_00740 [Thermoprotei archaeon]|nr:hypothetical protein [Thermoprotei archaeon]
MVKKAVSLLAVLLLAAAAVELASGSAPSSVVTPNAEITALHSEVTFTPFGVYVRDGIYIRAGSDGLSYLLIEVPSGAHPQFYDLTGYLKTKWLSPNIANVTLSSTLYANETWEIYASYVYYPSDLLLSPFTYHVWLYNSTVGNLTIFAYSPALSISGVPSSWAIASYKGLTHQEFYANASDVNEAEVSSLVITGYENDVTALDFFLTFVVVALAVVDASLYYAYRRRTQQSAGQVEERHISDRTRDAISSISDLVKDLLESRKALPIKKGDVQAVNRWINSSKQKLEALDASLESLQVREKRKDDLDAIKEARDYLQIISLDLNGLFDLDLRLASKKISQRTYDGMEKQRLKSIYRSLEKINSILSRTVEEG